MTSSEEPATHSRRIPAHGPEGELRWMQLYIQPIEGGWAAMVLTDSVISPKPAELKGIGFWADTAKAADRLALTSLVEVVAQN